MTREKKLTPQENLEQNLTKTIRAIADNNKIEVLFGHKPRVSGDIVFMPKPQRLPNKKKHAQMRGLADSLSLRFVYHNTSIHNKFSPPEAEAKELFDIAEQVRVEKLGADTMVGCAHNLHEMWLARSKTIKQPESFDSPVPAEVLGAILWEKLSQRSFEENDVMDLWRRRLKKQIGTMLDEIAALTQNQTEFAKKIQYLLSEMGITEVLPQSPEEAENDEQDLNESSDLEQEQQSSETDATQDQPDFEDSDETMEGEDQQTAQNTEMEDNASEMEEGEQPIAVMADSTNAQNIINYKIFTTSFDETIAAENLCELEETQRLRSELDSQLINLHGLVGRLANRLQKHLMAHHNQAWECDLEEGFLDPSRLERVIINPISPLAYRQQKEVEFRDTVVTLLLDNSGSMRGRPITVAALCADIFARTLERCGVATEILGFTTKHWKGGKSRERWLETNRPLEPGRLNDIRHIIYKSADTPWRRARNNLGLMLREGLLKENIDGEALLWAHGRLLARKEERKILMIISDGAPVDDATLSANSTNYLEKHLRSVIGEIENKSPVELLAIGIGHDVTRYYKKAVTILDAEQLGEAIIGEFVALFDRNQSWKKGPARAHIKARRHFAEMKVQQ